MNPSLDAAWHPEPSALSLRKSTLYCTAFAALLVVETFSGPLRYYLDGVGLAPLLYLPKTACLAAALLELFVMRGLASFWLVLLAALVSSQIAVLHGATAANIAFALFGLAPLIFGVICGRHLLAQRRALLWIIGLCLAASLVGTLVDRASALPWEGYNYTVGDNELNASRAWTSAGVERIAGFARMSTILSVMLAVYSLFLGAFIRSPLLRGALYAATFAGIWISTNKSTLAAYTITLAFMAIAAYRPPVFILAALTVLVGLALPVTSLTVYIDPLTVSGASDHVLSSLNDRLANTWPNYIRLLADEGWLLWGAGLGMVGSTGVVFPIHGMELLIVADNTALYLWGTLGLLGGVLYLLLLPLLVRLQATRTRLGTAFLAIVFCLSMIAWTTDILETPAASLFLGIAIALAMAPRTPNATRQSLPARETE